LIAACQGGALFLAVARGGQLTNIERPADSATNPRRMGAVDQGQPHRDPPTRDHRRCGSRHVGRGRRTPTQSRPLRARTQPPSRARAADPEPDLTEPRQGTPAEMSREFLGGRGSRSTLRHRSSGGPTKAAGGIRCWYFPARGEGMRAFVSDQGSFFEAVTSAPVPSSRSWPTLSFLQGVG
jgi:hypothetical protein